MNDPESLAEYVYVLVREVARRISLHAQLEEDITGYIMDQFLSKLKPEDRLVAMKHISKVKVDRREVQFRVRSLTARAEREFSELITEPPPIFFVDIIKLIREVDKSVTSIMKLDNVYNSILGKDIYGGVLMTEESIVKFLSSMNVSQQRTDEFLKFIRDSAFSISFTVGRKNFHYFLPFTLTDEGIKTVLFKDGKTHAVGQWDSSLWIGKEIDVLYTVEEIIAKGGNSYVLKARAGSSEVALKVPVITHDPGRTVLITGNTLMDMFREVSAVKVISENNKEYLVEITGVNFSKERILRSIRDPSFYYENPPYIAMEFMQGTLRSLMNEKLMSSRVWEEIVKRAMFSVAKGLSFLHEGGFVHLDIKPSNILISSQPRGGGEDVLYDMKSGKLKVKVGDLGSVTRTGEKVVHATPCYAPGDQVIAGLKGEPSSPYMDVYAFGATFYEMLTGKMLNLGIAEKFNEAITLHDPDVAREVWNQFTPDRIEGEIGSLIMKCVSKDPEKRPKMTDILNEVEAMLDPLP
ncbi:serine/threonine-protein kinase [Sulfuracidifex tepidarius]|uniref:Protein kinase domain-containing protein n=1 Tax=Sulfuracidifex tepidarius TaxID=1294262 RepID=A0A510DZJ4_9CREN|nr:serine/threonine-protein kinase [Sulfuracidifex tepidarius]BBG22912.1 hypothetical protein IC006_0196 [Sulfuracidifex tepidarius]BBG25672.1 hypothetical protein IC007_0177 [Sulfuracidifex tepidarius]